MLTLVTTVTSFACMVYQLPMIDSLKVFLALHVMNVQASAQLFCASKCNPHGLPKKLKARLGVTQQYDLHVDQT